MDIHLLEDIGLTKVQAAAYEALVKSGASGAPAIAVAIKESRSNTYKVLDRLCDLGLASKSPGGKKILYYPSSPAALEQLLQREAALVGLRERKLKSAMPDLMNFFLASSEQPGVRFYQGPEGLKQIYEDQIKTNKQLYYIRSLEDVRFFALPELHAIRNAFVKRGIPRRAITQDIVPNPNIPENERAPIKESDAAMLLTRTWIDPEDYEEPVEWAVYGDKLSIISYGKEAIGMVIESSQIAAAFRRLFTLLDEGIRRRPGYALRPLRTTYTVLPDSMRPKKTKR
jgi:HTH-type transcriptional regulator, sugar sensing transcriptional regulator